MLSRQQGRLLGLIAAGIVCAGIWSWYLRYQQESAFFTPTVYLTTTNAPLQIFGAHNGVYIVPPDGSIWIWGTVSAKLFPLAETPRKLPFTNAWKHIGGGYHNSVGIREDGTLWHWGRLPETESNVVGRTYYYSKEPVQISTDTNWVSASVDLNSWFGVGVKKDGTLWGWGDNRFNALGEERSVEFKTATPVQITTETNWAEVMAAHQFALGLKRDGTLWIWGGASGHPTTNPRRVSSDSNWVSLLHYNLARTSKGEVWTISSPAPNRPISKTREFNLITTNTVSGKFCFGPVGDALMLYDIKNDGALWGRSHPSMGHPSANKKYHQIGTRKDWVRLWSAGGACFGLTSDNTLWHWGHDLGAAPVKTSRITSIANDIREGLGFRVKQQFNRPPSLTTPRPLVIFQQGKRNVVNNGSQRP